MMSTKKYRIRLTTDEQQELNALVSRGRAAAYKQTHARILLMSDESRSDGGMKDADITSALGVGQSTVERIRKRCVEEGVESALNRKKQLEIHYTPKHGSWLNMAEIEIGVLARQCLDRRIANQDILRGEVNAWQNQRNRDVIRVDWRFTTEDARIKLKSLYPSIQKR